MKVKTYIETPARMHDMML